MAPRVLVACIGNIFLGDDAFGVEVARELANHHLPEGVQVVDFGIRSYDLAYTLMEDWDLVIMVDAVPRSGAPGTVYVIEPEWPGADDASPALDAHTMNPVAVLQMVSMLGGGPPKHILVVGCEPTPADTEDQEKMELSEPVRAAVSEAAAVVQELVASVPGTNDTATKLKGGL